jgi:hypothetical protein
MAGPCVMDGDCTEFYMDGDNLRVDLVIDPSTDNAASCGLGGLFVQKRRARYVEGTSSTPMVVDGVSTAIAGIHIDIDDWAAAAPGLAGTPRNITETETIVYTNSTDITEVVRFEFMMGYATQYMRGGWDVHFGIKSSWFGPADLTPVSAFYTGQGFSTGGSAFDQAYDASPYPDPFGHFFAPMAQSGACEMAPGETLTLQWRIFALYEAPGLPTTSGYKANEIIIVLGSTARVFAWSKG